MVLSLEKIVFAKRTAMDTCFWCACTLDDDDGFDRLIGMQSKDQLNSPDWGSVFLHKHLEDFEIEKIQRVTGSAETPVVALASSGSRYFLRQLTESTVPNLYYMSHNEIPAGVRVVSLGLIQ